MVGVPWDDAGGGTGLRGAQERARPVRKAAVVCAPLCPGRWLVAGSGCRSFLVRCLHCPAVMLPVRRRRRTSAGHMGAWPRMLALSPRPHTAPSQQ